MLCGWRRSWLAWGLMRRITVLATTSIREALEGRCAAHRRGADSGGLGPTPDDLTVEALLVDVPPVVHEPTLEAYITSGLPGELTPGVAAHGDSPHGPRYVRTRRDGPMCRHQSPTIFALPSPPLETGRVYMHWCHSALTYPALRPLTGGTGIAESLSHHSLHVQSAIPYLKGYVALGAGWRRGPSTSPAALPRHRRDRRGLWAYLSELVAIKGGHCTIYDGREGLIYFCSLLLYTHLAGQSLTSLQFPQPKWLHEESHIPGLGSSSLSW
jgi:hypothetical protein